MSEWERKQQREKRRESVTTVVVIPLGAVVMGVAAEVIGRAVGVQSVIVASAMALGLVLVFGMWYAVRERAWSDEIKPFRLRTPEERARPGPRENPRYYRDRWEVKRRKERAWAWYLRALYAGLGAVGVALIGTGTIVEFSMRYAVSLGLVALALTSLKFGVYLMERMKMGYIPQWIGLWVALALLVGALMKACSA